MNIKSRYNTKQREELLLFLQSVNGTHVTVNDICDYFNKKGLLIGTTTVYRQLERMVAEGLVNKYIVDGTSGACFEYIGETNPCLNPLYSHCKCEICGKLIHLKCDEVTRLQEHMFEEHGFTINSFRTVFYGICEECNKKQL